MEVKSSDIIALLEEGKKVTKKSWKHRDMKSDPYVMLEEYPEGIYSWQKKYIRIYGQTCSENYVIQSILSEPEEWEEYKEYPKDLSFIEACRLACENGAIISTTGRVKYDWHNGILREYSTRKPFESDLFIFHEWHVVEYKGEEV